MLDDSVAAECGACNPWTGLGSAPPYIAAVDEPYITAWNSIVGTESPFFLDLSMPPEPFLGRWDAPLVVLSANPGRVPGDSEAYRHLGAAERLTEIGTDGGTRFRWLADDVASTPGGQWWRRCLGGLRDDGYSFDELADCVMAVEFHGYHSARWSPPPVTLPSQWFGFRLVGQAMDRGAVIVVTRAARQWLVAVPGLAAYRGLVRTKSAQTASLGTGNLGQQEYTRVTETIERHRAGVHAV